MTSGPVVVSVLEGENAVLAHRDILGATNPKEAALVLSVQISQLLLMRMLLTVQTQLHLLSVKLLTSLLTTRSAHALVN